MREVCIDASDYACNAWCIRSRSRGRMRQISPNNHGFVLACNAEFFTFKDVIDATELQVDLMSNICEYLFRSPSIHYLGLLHADAMNTELHISCALNLIIDRRTSRR